MLGGGLAEGGNFGIEVFDSATAGASLRIVATGVKALFGDGTNNFVTFDGGTGFLIIRGNEAGGSITGNVTLDVPGAEFAGRFTTIIKHHFKNCWPPIWGVRLPLLRPPGMNLVPACTR